MPTSDSHEVPQSPNTQSPNTQSPNTQSPNTQSLDASLSSTATAVQPSPSDDAQTNRPSSGNAVLRFIGSVFTLIFRLGLLTGGAGLALVVGVAIATIRPAEVTNEPPLLETVIQQVDRLKP